MKKILIVLGHNFLEYSKVNRSMIEKVSELDNVTVLDLYERYADAEIDKLDKNKIEEDRKLVLSHDVIIFQFPFRWYTSPPLVDLWREKILGYNWAFGKNYALEGKETTVAFTAGEVPSDYGPDGVSLYDPSEFMLRFESTASYCKMMWRKPFQVVGASHVDSFQIEEISNEYLQWIKKL